MSQQGTNLVRVSSGTTDQKGRFFAPEVPLPNQGQLEIHKAGFERAARSLADLREDPVIYLAQDATLVPWQALRAMTERELQNAALGLLRRSAVSHWPYLTNLLSEEDVLRPIFMRAVTNADERVALGAANFLCVIGQPEEIEHLLAQRDRMLEGRRGGLFAAMLASALPTPFSEKAWQHLSDCLGQKFGRGMPFTAAVETIVMKGSDKDRSRFAEIFSVISARGHLNKEDRRFARRAIGLTGKVYGNSNPRDATTVAREFIERLGSLYGVEPLKPTMAFDRQGSKALVSFSTGGQSGSLYRMCMHKVAGRWVLASLRWVAIG